ncbi:MAG: chemotaxis response regulator protein-glutamate methylesterase, partial [Gammaproteobacteria bacterium]|nr:chemotaxis response regulator protein-glutamate methylesterase [Gammaproteobacteria bacterium]
ELCARVRVLAARGARSAPVLPAVRDVVQAASARVAGAARYRVVAIGASTGGPVALQQVLMNLPKTFPLPILLIQHMPATFTGPYALRLAQTCRIAVREATDGDVLRPGEALLAPGGKQLTVELHGSQAVVRLREPRPDETYRPCVDIAFASLSQVYAAKVLALVLTGMGADGREGARQLKQAGASVWAQDEKTCVVYGMPAAVAEAGLADRILPLPAIGPGLASEVV